MAGVDSIWIGFDPRQVDAYAVARSSIRRNLPGMTKVSGLLLSRLQDAGLYKRPVSMRGAQLWDDISEAPMSTEFACSRFLIPHLCRGGWALFVDCDVLIRRRLADLFRLADPDKAVMVVKHDHRPSAGEVKMVGQAQTQYPRKNWSSVVLWNLDHEANAALTLDMVNRLPGRDLHRFSWLEDNLIGELPVAWNWLEGHSDPEIDPALVHFTNGVPSMPGYEQVRFAEQWRSELHRWAV